MKVPKPITGPWTLKQLHQGEIGQPRHGLKVLSTFSCGGGSSMGYKLSGFDVVGCVEIDPAMIEAYKHNLMPKHPYLMPIQEFNKLPIESYPEVFRDLDVLDGSPPCSVFSIAGKRERGWGVEKKFREGQSEQRLDDLFFHFIDTARRLKPKCVVAENVTGMLKGSARGYVKEIFQEFDKAGYNTRLFLLDSSMMGVPQRRQRIFFIGFRKDLGPVPLELGFNDPVVTLGKALEGVGPAPEYLKMKPAAKLYKLWTKTMPGRPLQDAAGEGAHFTNFRCSMKQPTPTLTSSGVILHPTEPRRLSPDEIRRIQSFPDDYWFSDTQKMAQYICGMSVPPLMMQRISGRIAEQLLTLRDHGGKSVETSPEGPSGHPASADRPSRRTAARRSPQP